ncbi:hypothetical protein [Endozoicomonas numazuensis]|uniref:Uncharacterized protein n=1 Tax=Endozoicomonas numazuensis TaxID=1137799 RepID=A0A081NCX0_9GAMM|nr:hypothetical protein [Endozoicomonas numazuensis]KEQ16293.1 hypothetical protein GZ78_24115 [Endozoicomonas numazuensis]
MRIKKLARFINVLKVMLCLMVLLVPSVWAAPEKIDFRKLHEARLSRGANPIVEYHLTDKISMAVFTVWALFSSQSKEMKAVQVVGTLLLLGYVYQQDYFKRPVSWYLYIRDWLTTPNYESKRAELLAEVEGLFSGKEDKRKLAVMLVNGMPEEDLMVVSAEFIKFNIETKTEQYCTHIGKPYASGLCDLGQLSADFYLHVLPYRSGAESLPKLAEEVAVRLAGKTLKTQIYEDFCNNYRWKGKPCAVFWSPFSDHKYSEALENEERPFYTVLKLKKEIKSSMLLRYDFFLQANSPRLVSAQTSSFEKAILEERVEESVLVATNASAVNTTSGELKVRPLTVQELGQLPGVYTLDRQFGERSRWTGAFKNIEKEELALSYKDNKESYLCNVNHTPLFRIPAGTQSISIPVMDRLLYRGSSPFYGYEPCGYESHKVEF